MKIDNGSLAFNVVRSKSGGGTPSWGTSIVTQNEDNKIKEDFARSIIVGMVYNWIDVRSHRFSMPIGKGGRTYFGDDDLSSVTSIPIMAAYFQKVYVNGKYIGEPFILVITKDQTDFHDGRLQLKYSPKITFGSYSNQMFFDKVESVFNIEPGTTWYVTDIDVIDQDQLRLRAEFE